MTNDKMQQQQHVEETVKITTDGIEFVPDVQSVLSIVVIIVALAIAYKVLKK